jgi:DNA-binding PadR family transcriptional regulator
MKPEHWTLLVICTAKSKGLSPVQLQKTLFLLQRRLPKEDVGDRYYEFTPYNYGPFNVTIYQDAETMEELGWISINHSPGGRWKVYRATPIGLEFATKLRAQASPHALEYLDTIVTWVLGLSFRELVSAIYAEYPEFRANSVFQE